LCVPPELFQSLGYWRLPGNYGLSIECISIKQILRGSV
jgi:hypothetical protein